MNGGTEKYGRIFTEADVRGLLEDLAGQSAQTDVRGYCGMLAERVGQMKSTFGADEPVFVLRGQDEAARMAIADYLVRCGQVGAAKPHLAMVNRDLSRFGKFAGEHPERMKVPDSEPPGGGCPECGAPKDAGHAQSCMRAR